MGAWPTTTSAGGTRTAPDGADRPRAGVGGADARPASWAAGSAPAPGRPAAGCARRRPRHRRGPAASPCARRERAAEAEGAGESGLSRLIELHAFNAAGDAAVAISLAGTLFFQVPTGRGPRPGGALPGPDDAAVRDRGAADRPVPRPVQPRPALGDRRDHGGPRLPVLGAGRRRSTATRPWLFPAALGVLVASKAYGVTRAAAVPRLLPARLHPGQGQRPDLAGRHRRGRRLGADRGAGVAGRAGVVAALRLRGLRRSPRSCAIRLPAEVDSSQGEGELSLARRGGAATSRRGRRRTRIPGRSPSRCAPTAGRAGSRVPHHVHGVPAAREPDRRPDSSSDPGAARHRDRRGRARQHPRHRAGLAAAADQPARSRWCSRCSADAAAALARRAVLRRADRWPCSASPPGWPRRWPSCPSTRRSSATSRAGADQRVRPQRHHAPAGLGDRRLRRHRDAAGPAAARAQRRVRGAGRVVGVRARGPRGRRGVDAAPRAARPTATRSRCRCSGRLRARARRRARAAAWRSASAVRASGCRPCR